MASSQVEIATSSSFGCGNGGNRCFQNNLKGLVASCIPDDNSKHIDYDDLWVHHPQWQTKNQQGNNNDDDNYKKKNDLSIGGDSKIETHKDKLARTRRQVVFSVDSSIPKRDGSNSPTLSESSVEISNLHGGVSSLVQKWRGFEAEARCSRTDFPDNVAVPVPVPVGVGIGTDDDSMFGDWESDRTTCSGPPSARSRDSDVTERERLRVADIIKKLTEDHLSDLSCDSSPRYGTSLSCDLNQADQYKCFASASPRLRGRQAFNDLLVQMEREKYKELEGLVARKAVSRFSQRGRIQAALRVRFLRRGLETKQDRHSNDRSCESHKPTRSTFTYIRERVDPSFSSRSVKFGSQPREETQSQHHHQALEVSKESEVKHKAHEVNQNQQQDAAALHSFEQAHEVTSPSWQETSTYPNNNGVAETVATRESIQSIQISMLARDEEASDHDLEYKEDKRHLTKTSPASISNASGSEESDFNHQQEAENTVDWISEVSRPRSDWECMRQVRYQEMLDPFLENDEIRLLLGRRSVSNFLSGCLREQIDRVMISRIQGTQSIISNHTQEEERVSTEEHGDENDELQLSDRGDSEDAQDELYEEKEDYSNYYDEYDESQSPMPLLYCDSYDNMDQMASIPQPLWTQSQVNDASDYSDQMATPCTQQSLSSNSYSQDNRPSSSSTSHPAIEMELICDLRGHMEQLHQEMSELRKSIKCCMNMQIKLQHSIKKQVTAALTQSANEKSGHHKLVKNVATGRRCCICRNMQVDSLFYRCGHMCTCFDCSHELQWSSGTCPICKAPIVDVVRAYSNFQT